MVIKYLKKKKAYDDTLLMEHLHNAMYQQEAPRSQKQLHASHVTKPFCPRSQYLIDRDKVKLKSETINVPLRYTFDEGKDKQKRFNNDWMREYHVGNWECRICGGLHTGLNPDDYPDQYEWEDCLGGSETLHQWEYKEVVFKDAKSGIIGSIDAILNLAPPKPFTVVEVKIMKGEDFRDLQAPLAEHTLRTMLYLYLIAHSNNPLRKKIDLTKAHVLYMARGFGYKNADHGISPFKDFVVPRNDKTVIPYVNSGYALKIAKKEKLIPMRVCDTINCSRAKQCPVSKSCFSDEKGKLSWAYADGAAVHKDAEIIACVEIT